MTPIRLRAEPGPIVSSLVALVVAVVGHGAFVIHTLLSRRRYRPLLDDGTLPLSTPVELLLGMPGPLYGAAFVLLAMALLVKEVAFERKEITLRINLAALALLAALWMTWNASVVSPAEELLREPPVKSGRLWVAGLLAFGVAGGAFAFWHWSRPENSVRWTFTQLHTSLLRKRREPVLQIVGPEVTFDGRRLAREDFLAAYAVPSKPGELDVAPCPACAGHWSVAMNGRAWCFAPQGRGWILHRLGPAPCDGT